MLIQSRPSWALAEHLATPEAVFLNRRQLLAGMGFGAIALKTGLAHAEDADPSADLYPAKTNAAYKIDRALTPEKLNSQYNNFYEFGSSKYISDAAQALKIRPWTVTVDGLVDKPVTLDFDKLVRLFALEERLYRHRCVEAWSMTVPWTGFALKTLLEHVSPKADAGYVRFESFMDPDHAPGQNEVYYPWPYVEGLSIEEARNDLAFMVTGAYGKPLAKPFGAPLRLATPWKYGFKSAKSIVRISLVAERPVNFWQTLGPGEYGFWANVNPQVPHPRWSQAEERVLGSGEIIPTRLFNGYEAEVAGLYKGLEKEALFM